MFLPRIFAAVNGSLYSAQLGNPFQCLFGNARTLSCMDVKELASDMSETSDLRDIAAPIQLFKTSIAASM